jgi:hypothetical protein
MCGRLAWKKLASRKRASSWVRLAAGLRPRSSERDPHRRKLPQEGDHAVVVLERVEPDPRQDVLAGDQILVVRLMHVPEDRHPCHTVLV